MNILVTFDYEIYFGENHGSVDKCIIYPTSELIRIAEIHKVNFCFFVDSGFILKLAEYKTTFPQLEKDYSSIITQIKYLSDSGHDIQLHIHPHWEDSYYNGEKWIINTTRYKLVDFSDTEISSIVSRYKSILREITGKEIFAYRAGGWCLQPFSKLLKAFKENHISLDSSVFRDGAYTSLQYAYDFRNSPNKDIYKFEDDPIVENQDGYFTELPISSILNSPFFFWKLFFLGRKNPYLHKPLGDGRAIPAPGQRKKMLTQYTNCTVSVDGYNAHLLEKSLKITKKKKFGNLVIIGHPKSLSRYSIIKLEEFIRKNKTTHSFTTYTNKFRIDK
ncbi:MAG: hypothetical protein WCP52_02965 [Bacteroidota bacterium]